MPNEEMGLEQGAHKPKNWQKNLKCIKIYYPYDELPEVEKRAIKAGFSSVGLYLKGLERRQEELIQYKREATREAIAIIRRFRLKKADFEEEGMQL